MTPEIKARQLIDQKLEQAGWLIQDMKQLNLGAAHCQYAEGGWQSGCRVARQRAI